MLRWITLALEWGTNQETVVQSLVCLVLNHPFALVYANELSIIQTL